MKKLVSLMVAVLAVTCFSMTAVAAEDKSAEKSEKVEKKDVKKDKKEAKKDPKKDDKKKEGEAKPAVKGKKEVSGC